MAERTVADALPFLHPILATAALGIAVVLASLGFQGRRRPQHGDLARHARLGPWALALMLAAWASGLASVVLWRDDLTPAASVHFRVGSAIASAFLLSALTSKRMRTTAVRILHPWIGAAALLLCGVQTILGLALLP